MMIRINNVSKIYSKISGNFNISFNISEGEVYGIMGANGAGKSTLLRQILGFIKPDDGEIYIDNINPFTNSEHLMNFTGYIPGELTLYDGLTGIRYLKIFAKLKNNVDWEFAKKLINFFELNVKLKIKKMSSGMKQKLAIISAIMHKPKLLILDEPTRGLDAAASEQFKEIILRFKNEFNATIIYCSHIFDEITKTCDRVVFIKQGSILKEFNVKESQNLKAIQEEFITLISDKDVKELF